MTEPRLLPTLPSPLRLYGAALLTSRKKNHAASLPSLVLARPNVTLDATHISRYAQICGFRPEQGVPLTYPHMLAFPLHMMLMADPQFPWSMMGMVHLANTVRQYARLEAGQTGRIEVCLIHPQSHDKGQVFCLQSRFLANAENVTTTSNSSGNCLWESESLYLRTGIATPTGPAYESTLGELTSTQALQTWNVSSATGKRYGFMSGDLNPIHLNRFAALAFGFPRAIAHGMWTKAHALAALMPACPVETARVIVEFKTPLFLPSQTTLWADPIQPAHGQSFEVRDARGEKPHLRGHWQASSGQAAVVQCC